MRRSRAKSREFRGRVFLQWGVKFFREHMATVRCIDLRDNLSDVLNFVRFKHGRVIITRRGQPVAELVPVERNEDAPKKFELTPASPVTP